MDPFTALGVASSIGGLISLAKDVYDAVWKGYLEQVIDAPRDVRDLHTKLKALEEVLGNFKELLESDADDVKFAQDSGLELARKDCEAGLQELKRRLLKEKKAKKEQVASAAVSSEASAATGPDGLPLVLHLSSPSTGLQDNTPTAPNNDRRAMKLSWRQRLTWPFKSEEITKTCTKLQEYCQLFSFCVSIENCRMMARSSKTVIEELKQQRALLVNGQAEVLTQIDSIVDLLAAEQAQINAISKDVGAIRTEADSELMSNLP
jgi:hypothetical protein